MKTLDIILACLMAWGAYTGYKKGLFIEVVNTIGLILAILAGFMLLDMGIMLLKPWFKGIGAALPIIAFVLIVVAVVYSVRILGRWARAALRQTLLGSLDTAAGAALGVLKITFAISSVIWVLTLVGFKLPPHLTKDTFIYPVVLKTGPQTVKLLSFLLPYLKVLLASLKQHLQH